MNRKLRTKKRLEVGNLEKTGLDLQLRICLGLGLGLDPGEEEVHLCRQ